MQKIPEIPRFTTFQTLKFTHSIPRRPFILNVGSWHLFRTRREARRFVRSPGEQTSRRKAATFVFDHQKQTSAPAWQVGKVSKRGQRVPTRCDPLAAKTS